jgi:glycosyltransferase involved in cell wall biosynthesis
LSKFKRLPFVFEIRDLWPESAIDTGVLQNKTIIKFAFWFERFIYKKASLINVLTPAFRDKLIHEKKVPKNKVIFIPNAADFSLAEKLVGSFDADKFRKDHQLENNFVITYVGAHGVANHLVQLLDAAEKLQGSNVLFQLIGSGMQKEQLIADATSRGLKNVKFVDPVPKEEVFKYILASDMGASVLKKVDTFKTIYSNKTFDYMSCKKSVLLAIDGVSRELVEKANCGIYVEPENTDDIVRGIKEALRRKSELATLGNNGYAYAKKHFDRTSLAKQYLEHVKDLLD